MRADVQYGRFVADSCAGGSGQRDVCGVGFTGVDDAGLGLVNAVLRAGELDLWPSAHDLVGVQALEFHTVPAQDVVVTADVARAGCGRVAPGQVLDHQPTRAGQQLNTGRPLHRIPGFVGVRREVGVGVLVLGQPNDPGMIVTGAVAVTEPELLQTENGRTGLLREPVAGRGPQTAAADDNDNDREVSVHALMLTPHRAWWRSIAIAVPTPSITCCLWISILVGCGCSWRLRAGCTSAEPHWTCT